MLLANALDQNHPLSIVYSIACFHSGWPALHAERVPAGGRPLAVRLPAGCRPVAGSLPAGRCGLPAGAGAGRSAVPVPAGRRCRCRPVPAGAGRLPAGCRETKIVYYGSWVYINCFEALLKHVSRGNSAGRLHKTPRTGCVWKWNIPSGYLT